MAAMLVQLGGCATPKHGWEVQEAAPESVLAEQSPDRVRVTKTDGTRLQIWEPQIAGDSLAGLTLPDDAVWIAGKPRPQMVPVSLPLQEIRRIEVPAVTGGQVALGLALGVLMAAAAVVVLGSVVKPFGN
jgi:hypothetical protein